MEIGACNTAEDCIDGYIFARHHVSYHAFLLNFSPPAVRFALFRYLRTASLPMPNYLISQFTNACLLTYLSGFASSLSRLSILWTTNPFLSSSTTSTSLAWTIWTINEPANYIIAACLPTLRPIFVRILPASFFILTRTRASQRVESPVGGSDSRKNKKSKVGTWTWTKTTVRGWGSVAPKVSVGSKGASRLSGPWDGPVWREEEEGGVSEARKKGRSEGVRVSEREIGEV